MISSTTDLLCHLHDPIPLVPHGPDAVVRISAVENTPDGCRIWGEGGPFGGHWRERYRVKSEIGSVKERKTGSYQRDALWVVMYGWV